MTLINIDVVHEKVGEGGRTPRGEPPFSIFGVNASHKGIHRDIQEI